MIIQKVKVRNAENPLDEQIINVPCENGEKIISQEPYVLEAINKYRATLGGCDIDSISDFESSSRSRLIDNTVVEKNGETLNVQLNKKYDFPMSVKDEDEEVVNAFEDGVKYKISVAATMQNGINISIKDSLKLSVKSELIAAAMSHDTSHAYTAKVDECVNGGYYVTIQGVKCFLPGSTASFYRLSNYSSILGKELNVIPTMYNRSRDMVVVSHTAFLDIIRPAAIKTVMDEDRNTEYEGVITLKKHDYVLIVFNGSLAGKLLYSDMDEETRKMFANNEIEIEKTTVKFHVDFEQNGQFMLTQNWYTKNLWKDKIAKEFKQNTVLDGCVISATKNFMLVQLTYNVIGTLPLNNTIRIGDHVKAKITYIDIESRKIKLTLC